MRRHTLYPRPSAGKARRDLLAPLQCRASVPGLGFLLGFAGHHPGWDQADAEQKTTDDIIEKLIAETPHDAPQSKR